MPDPLFTDLYRDTENLTWAPTEQVRRRGWQRTRRTRIAGGLATVVAVAVVATGAAALAGGHGTTPLPVTPATDSPTPTPTPSTVPTPTPTPSAAPGLTGSPSATTTAPVKPPASNPTATGSRSSDPAVPASAMLHLSDLPTGFNVTPGDADGDWTFQSVTIYCEKPAASIAVGQLAQRDVVFDSPTTSIIERVTRHSGDRAATSMDRVRQAVTDCDPVRAGDSLSIMAEGLGGDESLLVGSTIEGRAGRWLFVRQGDLLAQVWLPSDFRAADARPYARSVADRLCAGTDAC